MVNWVVVIAGLIPLWAAIFVTFSNMKKLKNEESTTPLIQETLPEAETMEEPVFSDLPEEPEEKDPFQDEVVFSEDLETPQPQESPVDFGLPKSIRRFWGAAFVLVFLACLAFSSEKILGYAFREYRWVIGMENPWIDQLAFNTMTTSGIAVVGSMVATLRTGIYLLRN